MRDSRPSFLPYEIAPLSQVRQAATGPYESSTVLSRSNEMRMKLLALGAISLILTTSSSVVAQCGGGRGMQSGLGESTGAARFAGLGTANFQNFAAGGNPQVFAMIQQMQYQNQLLQRQLLIAQQQMASLQQQNRQLLAQLDKQEPSGQVANGREKTAVAGLVDPAPSQLVSFQNPTAAAVPKQKASNW